MPIAAKSAQTGKGEGLASAFVGFVTNWPWPKVIAHVSWATCAFFTGLYAGLNAEEPEWFPLASTFVFFIAASNWILADWRRNPVVAEQYSGVAFLFFWPVMLPMYVAETRGWRRAVAAVVATSGGLLFLLLLGEVIGGLWEYT